MRSISVSRREISRFFFPGNPGFFCSRFPGNFFTISREIGKLKVSFLRGFIHLLSHYFSSFQMIDAFISINYLMDKIFESILSQSDSQISCQGPKLFANYCSLVEDLKKYLRKSCWAQKAAHLTSNVIQIEGCLTSQCRRCFQIYIPNL